MDKLDENIANAKPLSRSPSPSFVAAVMDKIESRPKPATRKIWIKGLASAFAVLAILAVSWLGFGGSSNTGSNQLNNSSNGTAPTTLRGISNQPSVASSLPSGTTNADLQNDINQIQSTINRENANQGGANTTLNDSNSEIQVPTS